jgi:hypothetical protein
VYTWSRCLKGALGDGVHIVQATLEAAVAGRLKVLYVTPECLAMSWVQRRLIGVNVSLVCIDEAHYASVTCANCRPGYLRLAKLLSQLAPSATRYVAPAAPDIGHSVMWQQCMRETSYSKKLKHKQDCLHFIRPFLDSSTNIYVLLSKQTVYQVCRGQGTKRPVSLRKEMAKPDVDRACRSGCRVPALHQSYDLSRLFVHTRRLYGVLQHCQA